MISSAPLVLVAAIGPKDVLLVVFALLAVGLLSTFLFMRNKLRESLVEKTRSDFAEELLAKFRRGMESRIGGGGVTAGSAAAAGGQAGEDRLLAYANIAEALSGGYECIYYIDLRTGHFDQYRSQGLYETLKVEKAGEDFFGVTQRLLPSTMHPDDLSRMQEAFRREAMEEATRDGRVFSITYRLRVNDEYLWYNFRAIRSSSDAGNLVGAISNVDEQMRREKGHEARADESVAKLEEMLEQSSRSRATLIKLATYQDADELRDLALRETGQALGAVAVYLYRHKMDGTTPLVHAWFRTPEYNVLPKNVAEKIGSPDYLDEHPDIRYVLGLQPVALDESMGEEMQAAVRALINQEGGFVLVRDGKVIASLALPIAGLMSDLPGEEVAKGLKVLHDTAYERLGVSEDVEPVMTLCFMSLIVIPELKISTRGMFDVSRFDFVPPEAD